MKVVLFLFSLFLTVSIIQGNSENINIPTENTKLIGNHLVIGINHYPLHPAWIKFIQDNEISGVIFVSKVYSKAENVRNAIKTLKEVTSHKMFFCVDQEGGIVNRIRDNVTQLPSAKRMAMSYSLSQAYELYHKQAKDLAALGINVNFSPVLDVIDKGQNKVIGSRSYGNNYEVVYNYGKEAIKASLTENILPVIKHFPGHGYTIMDSHKSMPIHENIKRLIKMDVVPFKQSIKVGAPAVMVAHILYPKIDNKYPASLSPEVITTYLKESLDFKGLIFSDDISMGAIQSSYKLEDAVKQAIEAGIHQTIIIVPLPNLKRLVANLETNIRNDLAFIDLMKHNMIRISVYK